MTKIIKSDSYWIQKRPSIDFGDIANINQYVVRIGGVGSDFAYRYNIYGGQGFKDSHERILACFRPVTPIEMIKIKKVLKDA